MDSRFSLLLLFYGFCFFTLPTFNATAQVITLETAIQKAFAHSPLLRIAANEVDQATGERIQSQVLPNPILSYSVENIYGNRNWREWDSAESRYEINQLIELGGKRCYRKGTATFQLYAAEADYEARQKLLLNRLVRTFTQVVAAQETLLLTQDQTKVAEEVYNTVLAKVEAGKVSLLQQNKAEIALQNVKLTQVRAMAELVKNKERLAALWGAMSTDFDKVAFPFYDVNAPISIDDCFADLQKNPQLIKSQMDFKALQQRVYLEKAISIPDLTLSLGYKTLRDTKNKGMMFGAQIPFPIFNRNQGNIQKARAAANQAQDEYLQLELDLENKLIISHTELMRSYLEVDVIRMTILKSATQSFELAKEGYREGKFEYLEMLDSQRTLFEVKERYIQALLSYHQSHADIAFLNTLDGGA